MRALEVSEVRTARPSCHVFRPDCYRDQAQVVALSNSKWPRNVQSVVSGSKTLSRSLLQPMGGLDESLRAGRNVTAALGGVLVCPLISAPERRATAH